MPQLKTTTYLSQYRSTVIIFFLLFSLMVGSVLPTLKSNGIIRNEVTSRLNAQEKGAKQTVSQEASVI